MKWIFYVGGHTTQMAYFFMILCLLHRPVFLSMRGTNNHAVYVYFYSSLLWISIVLEVSYMQYKFLVGKWVIIKVNHYSTRGKALRSLLKLLDQSLCLWLYTWVA